MGRATLSSSMGGLDQHLQCKNKAKMRCLSERERWAKTCL